MDSYTNLDFRKCFSKLPQEARRDAIAAYQQWKQAPFTPSLDFKPIDKKKDILYKNVDKKNTGTIKG